jgi:hypothetical protein
MHSKDYLPHNDGKLLAFSKNLISYLEKHVTSWNINPDSYGKLVTFVIAFGDALAKVENPNHGSVDVLAKNDIKIELTGYIRNFSKEYILYNHLITKEDLLAMGFKPRDETPTRVSIPTDVPTGEVNTSTHQQHTLRIKAGTLTGKSKPDRSVTGFELWRKVGGDPPANDEEWTYVDFSSRATMIVKYPLSDMGKTVYYRFRWINTRNEKGPWCEGYLIAVVP